MDAGFLDQEIFNGCEAEQVDYLCRGTLYTDTQATAAAFEPGSWRLFKRPGQIYQYVEWGDRRGSWQRFRRAIFCRPFYQDRQMLLDFARPDNLVYTNLGMGLALNHRMRAAGHADLLKAAAIIECYHGRGSDELVHRTFKDFGFEQLPFQRFVTNAAFYYMMMLAFVLFELFKKRVCASVIQTTAYASSLRRRLIDIAVKIVRHAGRVILKVPRAVHEQLNFERLWHHQTAPAG